MIKKIRANNFLSWEKLEFEIEKGVTLIEGWNHDDNTSEACGKSSIFDALCWGLFGRTGRDINTDEVIREGTKTCSVTIELKDGTKIVRRRNPNKLFIQKPNSEETIIGKDARETQEKIDELVGTNFTIFCQSCYFAQNYPEKFLTASPTDKSAILSKIQNLDIFDQARKKAVNKAKFLDEKLELLKKDIDHQQNILEHRETEKDGILVLKSQFEEQKANSIEKLENRLLEAKQTLEKSQKNLDDYPTTEVLNKKIESLETEISEMSEVKIKIASEIESVDEKANQKTQIQNKVSEKQSQIENESCDITELEEEIEKLKKDEMTDSHPNVRHHLSQIENIENEINNLKNPKDKKCPTCGTILAKSEDNSHIENHILKKVSDLKLAEKAIKVAKEEHLKQNQSTIDTKLKGIESSQKRINELKKEIEDLKEAISKVVIKSVEEYKKDLKKINSLINDKKIKKIEYNNLDRAISELKYSVKASKSEVEELLGDIDDENKKTSEKHDLKIKEIEAKMNETKEEFKKFKVELGEKQTERDNLEILKKSFKEVKQYLFSNLLAELTRRANRYLGEFFEVPIKVKFLVDTQVRGIPKINVSVCLDGKERSLGLYSGGQYKRIQLATDLALSDIVSSRGGKSLGLRIFDESLHNLSDVSRKKVLEILRQYRGSSLIIEHDQIFRTAFDNVKKVELIEGVSKWVGN